MPQTVQEIMSPYPVTVPSTSTVREAAAKIRDENVGDVIVVHGDVAVGILTDRDIVVRAVAEGLDPQRVRVGDVCSADVVTVSPDDRVEHAVQIMRERAVRRLPVVEAGRPVGVVSLGDLALERDPNSALSDISAAVPNQ
jgi:CBS domain-containing protein